MRIPYTRKALGRVSCILSGTTVLVGCVALFSNHWLESENTYAGFLSGCSGGFCTSTINNIPGDYRTTYAVGLTMMVFLPLVLIFVSAILQGITVWKGPSKRRDVSGLVLAWLSGYHSLLLTVLLIAATSMIPSSPDTDTRPQNGNYWTSTTRMPFNGEDYVMNSSGYSGGQYSTDFSFKVGWSAYFGLLAAILALASAVSSSLYFGMSDNEESEDVIPLESNGV